MAPGGEVIALVKPQFEAGRELVGKGGIVRDESAQRAAGFLLPTGYWLLPAFWPQRATLNCAPANRISPEMYAQKSKLTET